MDSWASARLPAALSLLQVPSSGSAPSPILASKVMPGFMYIMAPASPITVSWGVQPDLHELQVVTADAVFDFVTLCHVRSMAQPPPRAAALAPVAGG